MVGLEFHFKHPVASLHSGQHALPGMHASLHPCWRQETRPPKGGPGTQDGPAWVEQRWLPSSTGRSKKRSILRPRVSFGRRPRTMSCLLICRWCRCRRAGRGCSATIPGLGSFAWLPSRAAFGRLRFAPMTRPGTPSGERRPASAEKPKQDERRTPRSIRIAPAPLNSDRLPSMQRRREEYPSGLGGGGEIKFVTTTLARPTR